MRQRKKKKTAVAPRRSLPIQSEPKQVASLVAESIDLGVRRERKRLLDQFEDLIDSIYVDARKYDELARDPAMHSDPRACWQARTETALGIAEQVRDLCDKIKAD